MGVSTEFIKFIKSGCAFYFVLFCLVLPGFLKAQNNIPVTVSGKKYYKHIVVKGETVYGIAKKFNQEPKDIVLANPSASNGVSVGDTLLIPFVGELSSGSNTQDNYIYHKVVEKETLYSLSKKYNTTITAIDSLNPGLASTGLQAGHDIRIPVVQPKPAVINNPQPKQPVVKDTLKTVKPPPTQLTTNKNETQAYKTLVVEQFHTDTSKFLPALDTGKKMARYNIALIMPFAPGADTLHRLVSGTEQIPFTTRISVDFYHGIILAFDSLAKKGLKINLHVFNISPGPDSSFYATDSILKNPAMLQMNLIIGPPSSSNFKRVAQFAEMHHISILSPLSPESSILKNNPWTSKVKPSAVTETEAEADYIALHYKHATVILIHNRDADDVYYKVFKTRFIKADSAFGSRDTLYHAESIGGVSGLASKINTNVANVIVMPYQGAPFVAKFVNELANSKYSHHDSLVLFGMHNWADNDALDPANLDTLDFHFPSNEFVNYADSSTKKFIAKYRNNYLSEPGYFSYEGYDAGMFYGSLLQMYGTNMQNHLSDIKYNGLQTSFEMFRSSPTNGYENLGVYILEYRNYTEKLDAR